MCCDSYNCLSTPAALLQMFTDVSMIHHNVSLKRKNATRSKEHGRRIENQEQDRHVQLEHEIMCNKEPGTKIRDLEQE